MRPLHRNLVVFALALLMLPLSRSTAGTVDDLYSFNSYDGYVGDPTMYKLSIPTKKVSGTATEIPVVKAIVCVYPGMGGSGIASSANENYARWAYENGIAFWNVGPVYDPAADTVTYLASTGTRIGRPELANAPLIPTGESSGAYTAFDVATSFPARTLAVYGQHKGTTGTYFPPASVPAHVSFGEFDASRTEYMYPLALKNLQANEAAGGAPWSLIIDRGMIHTACLDYREDFMLYVETIIPLRYAYAQGVSGRDPAIGAVNLNALDLSSGWRGEHLLSPEHPDMAENGTLPYSLLAKDWDSAMLHISPAASFDRNNPHLHSWFPNAALASAWRSRAGLGARQMRFVLRNVPGNDYADNMLLPPMLNTDQNVPAALDTGAFPSAGRVDFYDNGTLVGTDTTAPYQHAYSWGSGAVGWHVLYAIATDPATGEQRVSGSRSVRVSPKSVASNSAPAVSAFTEQTIASGTANVSLPFTVSDAETAAASLTVKFFKSSSLDHAGLDGGAIAYSGTISGSGGSRTLNLTITDTAKSGVLWGYVQAHDGDLTTNSYFKINIAPSGPSAPRFVVGQTVNTTGTANGQVVFNGGWSKEIAIRVFDADTPSENLVLSATSATPAKIPLTNIAFGGYGEFRTVKIKCDGTTGSIMTFTVSDGVNTSAPQTYNPTIATASDTPPVVDLAPVINHLADVPLHTGEAFAQIARVHDFFTASEATGDHPKLAVTATSSNQGLLPNANLTVTESGAQRRIAGTTVSGQTGSAVVTVTVTDAQGLSASDSFTVTASAAVPPIIGTPPAGGQVSYNGTATLSVVASGGAPLSYQWYRGDAGDTSQPLPGATDPVYTTPALTASASYWVRVTNSAGGTNSSTAALTVTQPPAVTAQPASLGIYPGQTAALSVGTSGGGPLSYQWYIGASGDTGSPISGATAASYTTAPLASTASYWVRVSNISGTADSEAAMVTVKTPAWTAYHDTIPTPADNAAHVTYGSVSTGGVSTPLLNHTTGLANGVTLTGTLSSGGTKSNKTNGANTPSAGTDAYSAFNGIITFAQNPGGIDQVGSVSQYVTFTFSGVDSAKRYTVAFYTARNAFTTASKFTLSGVSGYQSAHSVGVGTAGDADPATVDVNTGTGSTPAGMLVKWVDIQPAGTSFSVRVDGYANTATLIPIGILLQEYTASVASPTITAQPSGSTIANGATASLSVTATGSGLTYQWYLGASGATSAPVSGATSASFTTPALNASSSYWVRVTNGGGSADSQAAAITVLTPLETWAAGQGLSGPDAGPDADPDGDGLVNLIEFALGGHPSSLSQSVLPTIEMPSASTLGLAFRRATDRVKYVVESSTTLAPDSWTAEYTVEKNTDPGTVGADVVIQVPMGTDTKKFLRLRVEE